MHFATYLGDAIYAGINEYGDVVLTTSNDGVSGTDTIVLDWEVIASFERWLSGLRAINMERCELYLKDAIRVARSGESGGWPC